MATISTYYNILEYIPQWNKRKLHFVGAKSSKFLIHPLFLYLNYEESNIRPIKTHLH